MTNPIRILIILLVLGLCPPASAAINASLEQDSIGPGETVQLTLRHDGQTDSQPDLSPLKQDFEIVGKSSASSIQFINGSMNSQVQLSLALLPKHGGKLQIPALRWDGQSSQVLALNVGSTADRPGNATNGQASRVFITATTDQKQPYVQAAVPLTVRIYSDQPLYQASLDFQPGKQVLVQQSGQDRQSSEMREGHNFQVIERKYLLFPQNSGKVRLEGPVLNAQVPDDSAPSGNDPFFGKMFGRNPLAGMLNATRPIRAQAGPVELDVRPRPASAGAHEWLPASKVTLDESWRPGTGQIRAGDPVTRHLHLSAEGLSAAQLPDLSLLMQLPAGLRAYPDQPRLSNDVSGNSIVGTRDQDIAIIAGNPGHYEIPATHLFWWDTGKNIQRTVDLPARTLDVTPGSGGIAVVTMPPGPDAAVPVAQPVLSLPEPNSENKADKSPLRWDWVSMALALLWLGTLAAWWFSRKRSAKVSTTGNDTPVVTPRQGDACKAFWSACQKNDPKAARRHLLAWAQAVWSEDPPAGLKALAGRLDDPAAKTLLQQLDRACYVGEAWQGGALMKSLRSLQDRQAVWQPVTELAGLYP